MKLYENYQPPFLMSTHKNKLDPLFLYDFLCKPGEQTKGLPAERLPVIVENSLCFGLYDQGKQIGFARVITDYAEFATLWDVFIIPEYRNRGLGYAFMDFIFDMPELRGIYRWFLMTDSAHGLYEKFGFRKETVNPYVMMRVRDVPLAG